MKQGIIGLLKYFKDNSSVKQVDIGIILEFLEVEEDLVVGMIINRRAYFEQLGLREDVNADTRAKRYYLTPESIIFLILFLDGEGEAKQYKKDLVIALLEKANEEDKNPQTERTMLLSRSAVEYIEAAKNLELIKDERLKKRLTDILFAEITPVLRLQKNWS